MTNKALTGILLDEHIELTLNDLCKACSSPADWIIELVEYGALEPEGKEQLNWRFTADSLHRVHTAMRLQRDLNVNLAGVALALELLDEIANLKAQLCTMTSNNE